MAPPSIARTSPLFADLMRLLRVTQRRCELLVRNLAIVILVGIRLCNGKNVLVRERQVKRPNPQLELKKGELARLVQLRRSKSTTGEEGAGQDVST